MSKIFKRIISLSLCMCMMVGMATVASAASFVEPRYIPCSSGGKHEMVGRGAGTLHLNGQLVFNGSASQCRNCKDVIVSEYNPYASVCLGRYGYWSPGEDISSTGTILNTGVVYYNDSLTGDEFFRAYVWL